MADLIYRAFTMEDYEKAYDLWLHTAGMGLTDADSRDKLGLFLRRNEGLSLVCADGDELAGTVLCGHDGRRGFLYHLAVRETYRGKGIGGGLVKRCLAALKDQGIEKCHIFVLADNELGINFWQGSGWLKRDDFYVFSHNT